MGKKHPLLTKLINNCLIIMFCLLILSGCETAGNSQPDDSSLRQESLDEQQATLRLREEKLSNREVAINKRETELVDILAALLEEKRTLADLKAKQDAENRAAALRAASNNQKTTTKQINNNTKQNNLKVLGGLEYVFLDPPGINFSARIDTGAQTSSLNALDMVEFERDGKPYIKFNIIDPETNNKIEITRRIRSSVLIKEQKGEAQRRPVVKIRIRIGNLDERINFTLADRSKFKQQVLIGRNFLTDLAVVDVSKEFTIPKFKPDDK